MSDDLPPTHICAVRWEDLTRRERLAEFWYDLPWCGRVVIFGMFPAALLTGLGLVAWVAIP